MKIVLNGKPQEIAASTIADALAETGFATAKVATALNGDFVPATARPETPLAEGDRLEIVAPRQGG